MKIKKIIRLIFIVLILIGIVFGIKISIDKSDPVKAKEKLLSTVFKDIQGLEVDLNKVYTYGKAINISGVVENISKDNFENAKLIIRDGNEYEKSYNLNYLLDKESKLLVFATDNNMNKGIIIDDLPNGTYYFVLRLKTNNSIDPKYYSFRYEEELGEFANIEYYTVTKDGVNKKVVISFDKMKYNGKEMSNLKMDISDAELPEDVYDIVIDAGHGGKDSGEKSGNITEAGITLNYAEKIKAKLEEEGYKVFLTRNRDNSNEFTYTNMYSENGRITAANESKAKLMISLHVNNNQNAAYRGVEVYSPPKSDYTFASTLARNIVVKSNLEFSNNNSFKNADGVYVYNYNKNMINNSRLSAEKKGYEPYALNLDTPYLYTIREVGGIATNAYVDGRNKDYDANKYYKSCQGIECYQLELGYIKNDLQIIQDDVDKVVDAIVETIKTNY